MKTTASQIQAILEENLNVKQLHIKDLSLKHKGHSGNTSGGGHCKLSIQADDFVQLTLIQQHRLVYKYLSPLIPYPIHALSIEIIP